MSTQKGATPALRLTLPGAPKTWHHLGGIDGLYHPDYAVPLDVLGLDEAAARTLVKGVPLTLEQASAADADAARAAYAEHTGVPAETTETAAPAVVPDTPKED